MKSGDRELQIFHDAVDLRLVILRATQGMTPQDTIVEDAHPPLNTEKEIKVAQ